MRKINIAVIDGNLLHRDVTREMLTDWLARCSWPASLSEFGSGPELMQEISLSGQYDIYIMEVAMPTMNGITLAERLRDGGDKGIIIYLTQDPGNAYRAFGVKASDYLLKPVTKERLNRALDDALTELNKEYVSPVIELKLKTGLMRVPLDNITHVDIVGRALCFHMSNGMALPSNCLRGKFDQAVIEIMGDISNYPDFMFAGKSNLINLSYVMQLRDDSVVLTTDEVISIPKSSILSIRQGWLSRKFFI